MDFSELMLRIPLSFFLLLALTRIMGRKEISQMTFFNFASGIAIGELAAALVLDRDTSIENGMIALTGWTILTLIMGFVDIKFQKARTFLVGDPVIVVKHGRLMERALRKTRLDIHALRSLLREKDIFSMSEVEYAIFEVDGSLSIMKKQAKEPLTKEDMPTPLKHPPKSKPIPLATQVISDGKISTENLSKLNLSKEWLNSELQKKGVSTPADVFYGEILEDGTLYIDEKAK